MISTPSIKLRQRRGEMQNKKEEQMSEKIRWEKDLNEALNIARGQNKPVLLDFFNPN
jgi:thiol:disulfide interchange protein